MNRPQHAFALSLAAALALAGCGKSDKAGDAASADNVEMPAEEALSGATAMPSADPSALAGQSTDEADSADSAAASAATTASPAAKPSPAEPAKKPAPAATPIKM